MPFELSKSIKKEVFISNSNESYELSRLLLAPFGVSNQQENNSHLLDLEACQAYYHQIDEIISRHIYKSQNIPDDVVASSFHDYIEVNKDSEVS